MILLWNTILAYQNQMAVVKQLEVTQNVDQMDSHHEWDRETACSGVCVERDERKSWTNTSKKKVL